MLLFLHKWDFCPCDMLPLLYNCILLVFLIHLFFFQQKPHYDANKLYCSEILSILLQNTEGKFVFQR